MIMSTREHHVQQKQVHDILGLMFKKSHNRSEGEKDSFSARYDDLDLDQCGLMPPTMVRCGCTESIRTFVTAKEK